MNLHLTQTGSRRPSRLLAAGLVTLCCAFGALASSASAILPTTTLTTLTVLPTTTLTTISTSLSTLTTLTVLPTTITVLPTTSTTLTTLTTLPTTSTTLTTLTTLPTTSTTLTTLPTTSSTTLPTTSSTTLPTTGATTGLTTGLTTGATTGVTTGTTLPTTGTVLGGTTGGVPLILPGPGGIPTLTLSAFSPKVKKGILTVPFDTSGGTTTALLFVTKKLAGKVGIAKAKTVLIGKGVVTVPAGHRKVNVKLNKKSRKALKKKGSLKSTLQLQTVSGGKKSPTVRRGLTLKT